MNSPNAPSPKRLLNATIIPDHLYVRRAADKQLERILEEMGRPAYVLVARQMGKTNLLLHAKRRFEGDQKLFLYVDLSGSARSAQECFRGIIDAATGTRPDLFDLDATAEIRTLRGRGLAPNREHEAELRVLLRNYGGKLVIILDEIDSLTRADFSDQVFAQIRGMYFSRVNVPEFDRLTYVLSGVAEPSELIKDPKLSPFNIGEKIYLDDFTYDEFTAFVENAGLGMSDGVRRHFYGWTSGHPRMTWDIAAAIEDRIASGGPVTERSVDDIVQTLFLTAFDRAPIDNIRSLVEGDRELRGAVVQIWYGKGGHLPDVTKARLYLAGAIGSNLRRVILKNRIVEAALSLEWLRDIERRTTPVVALAKERFDAGEYGEAAALFEEVLRDEPDAKVKQSIHTYLGDAYFALGQFEEAIRHLESGQYDRLGLPELYFKQRHKIGVAYYRLQKAEESIAAFEEITLAGANSSVFRQAMVNLGSALLLRDFEANASRAVAANEDVLAAADAGQLSKEERESLLPAACFNLAQIQLKLGDLTKSREYLARGAELARPIEVPRFLVETIRLHDSTDGEGQRELARKLVRLIVEQRLGPVPRSPDAPLALDDETLLDCLVVTFEVDPDGVFREFWSYAREVAPLAKLSNFAAKHLVGVHAMFRTMRSNAGFRLLREAVKEEVVSAEDEELRWMSYKFLGRSAGEGDEYRDRYAQRFTAGGKPSQLDMLDFRLLASAAAAAIVRGDLRVGEEILQALASYQAAEGGTVPRGDFIYVDYLWLHLFTAMGRTVDRSTLAAHIVARIGTGFPETKLISREVIDEIARFAREILGPSKRLTFPFGRNQRIRVRYADGQIREDKFKRLEGDLRSGKCEVVE